MSNERTGKSVNNQQIIISLHKQLDDEKQRYNTLISNICDKLGIDKNTDDIENVIISKINKPNFLTKFFK